MLVAITGANTKVGKCLVKRGLTPLVCDVTDKESVMWGIRSVDPDVIIYCHEFSDLAGCENDPKKANLHNMRGLYNVIDNFEGRLIYLSSYHVFNGKKFFPYSEKHEPNPINAYGFSKWGGEILVDQLLGDRGYVIRLGEVFESDYVGDYPNLSKKYKRSFIYSKHTTDCLLYFVENIEKMPNLLHIGSQDILSYPDFCSLLEKETGVYRGLRDQTSDVIPANGGLSVRKANKLGFPKFTVLDGIRQMLKDYKVARTGDRDWSAINKLLEKTEIEDE